VKGTYEFVKKSALPLHHKFAVSELTINPIIHGPLSQQTLQDYTDKTYIEALSRRAVVKNRSNCVVVYQHSTEGEPFFASNLQALFTDPENDVSRDQVVIVANIGLATTRSEVLKRLSDACQHTGMEMIDIVMFEVSCTSTAVKYVFKRMLTSSNCPSFTTTPADHGSGERGAHRGDHRCAQRPLPPGSHPVFRHQRRRRALHLPQAGL